MQNKFSIKSSREYTSANPESGNIIQLDYSQEIENVKIHIYILKNITVLLRSSISIITTQDNSIISDNFPDDDSLKNLWEHSIIQEMYSCNEIHELKGEYFLLVGLWSGFFLHWLSEFIPRIMILQKSNFKGKYIIYKDMLKAEYITDTLEMLGIKAENLLIVENQIIKIEKLHVLERLYFLEDRTTDLKISDYFLNSVRHLMINNLNLSYLKPTKRIYLSRKKANNSRKIINEAEIIEILKKYQFKSYVMEALPFKMQIKLASKSNCIIGGHGAGMFHSLFMPPGSLVVEFFNSVYIEPCFTKISKLLNHKHIPLISESPLNIIQNSGTEDVYVEINKLEELLNQFLQ